jgi:hypothetical protein
MVFEPNAMADTRLGASRQMTAELGLREITGGHVGEPTPVRTGVNHRKNQVCPAVMVKKDAATRRWVCRHQGGLLHDRKQRPASPVFGPRKATKRRAQIPHASPQIILNSHQVVLSLSKYSGAGNWDIVDFLRMFSWIARLRPSAGAATASR